MTKSVKFMFENAFDGESAAGQGPNDVYFDNRPKFGARDMEKARDDAFTEGVTSGIQQSLSSFESQIAATLNRVGDGLNILLNDRRKLSLTLRSEATILAHQIACKLATALMTAHPQTEVEALIGDCLADRHDEPRIVIRVNESQLDPLKQRIEVLAAEKGFDGHVMLLCDEAISVGDCRLEWADGGLERNTEQLTQMAQAAVTKYLSTLSVQPTEERAGDPTKNFRDELPQDDKETM